MADSLEPPVSGLVAGKYEVVRLIGRGGMGSVWEGRHASLGTRVAIKFIDQEYAESKEAQTRFVTEARAAASIQSKHAIHIFDHGVTDDGRPYMVMELLVGEPLDKRIERAGRITLAETARIVGQVCRALQRAHDAGIIHRDLKPENIFIVRTPDDDDDVAKVLDFGIAKIKGPPGEKGLTSSTKTGAVLGTPYYMSPEQARGLRSIDHRSDLWSLGVIAYKCVTGVLPFEGESVGDLLVKICTGPLPVPSMTMPGLPPSFDAWFARALERDPAARFATSSELGEALAFAAGLTARRGPTSSQPEGATAAMTPRSQHSPESYGATTPALTPLPGAGLTSAPFVTSAQPPKSGRGILLAVAAAALVGGTLGVVGMVKLLAPKPVGHPMVSAAAVSMGSAGVGLPGPGVGGAHAPAAPASASTGGPLPAIAATSLPTAPAATATPHPHPGGRPAGGSHAPGLPATGEPPSLSPVATATTPPAPTKPSPVKPPPTSADPGY